MTPWICALPWLHYLNFAAKECYHAARFEKETRYYVIRLEKDLFDDWIITAINGRINSKRGQIRIIAFLNFNEALEHFFIMAKERNQRGYSLTSLQSDDFIFKQILLFCVRNKQVRSLMKKNNKRTPIKEISSSLNPEQTTMKSQVQETQQLSFSF